jgi:hypothetical protein
VGDEAVVAGIVHGGVQEPVDEQRARVLVDLVLDRHAAERDLDHGVQVGRWVPAGGNLAQVHLSLRWQWVVIRYSTPGLRRFARRSR